MFKYLLVLLLFASQISAVTLTEYIEEGEKKGITDPAKMSIKFEDVEITSFEEAFKHFGGYFKRPSWTIISKPMSLKGRLIGLRFKIAQVLGDRKFLLFYSSGRGEIRFYILEISKQFTGNVDFVDDQIINIIGKITKTESYNSISGKRTVPLIRALAVK